MTHALKPQEEVDLTKKYPGLRGVTIGFGWKVNQPENAEHAVDIDASAFLLRRDERVRHDADFVFYNNPEAAEGGIIHHTAAAGGEDREMVEVQFDAVSFDIEKISLTLTIHNAEEREHSFAQVSSAHVRVANRETGEELLRFDIPVGGKESGSIVGELLRNDGVGWKFKALGRPATGGLYRIAKDYHVNVAPP